MPTTQPAPTSDDIRLDLISMHEWRVCDRRFPENDSLASATLSFCAR